MTDEIKPEKRIRYSGIKDHQAVFEITGELKNGRYVFNKNFNEFWQISVLLFPTPAAVLKAFWEDFFEYENTLPEDIENWHKLSKDIREDLKLAWEQLKLTV